MGREKPQISDWAAVPATGQTERTWTYADGHYVTERRNPKYLLTSYRMVYPDAVKSMIVEDPLTPEDDIYKDLRKIKVLQSPPHMEFFDPNQDIKIHVFAQLDGGLVTAVSSDVGNDLRLSLNIYDALISARYSREGHLTLVQLRTAPPGEKIQSALSEAEGDLKAVENLSILLNYAELEDNLRRHASSSLYYSVLLSDLKDMRPDVVRTEELAMEEIERVVQLLDPSIQPKARNRLIELRLYTDISGQILDHIRNTGSSLDEALQIIPLDEAFNNAVSFSISDMTEEDESDMSRQIYLGRLADGSFEFRETELNANEYSDGREKPIQEGVVGIKNSIISQDTEIKVGEVDGKVVVSWNKKGWITGIATFPLFVPADRIQALARDRFTDFRRAHKLSGMSFLKIPNKPIHK